MDKMNKVVGYYLGENAISVSSVVLDHLARRLDETGYTYCCFWAYLMRTWEKHKLIHRNFLESPKVWELFLAYRALKPDVVRVDISVELNRFNIECNICEPSEVLADDSVTISPLIRYTMGAAMNLPPEIYEKYRNAARQQLREEPLLFTCLEKVRAVMPITEEEVMNNE